MADRFYGYQYDTNPRKLNLENAPYKNRYPKEKKTNLSNMSVPEQRKRQLEERKMLEKNQRKQQDINNNYNNSYNKNIKKTSDKNIKHDNYEVNNNSENNVKINPKVIKLRLKIVFFIIAGFSVLFAISYQNSLISESFNKKEQYKKEWESLSKTNQQIEVNIQNSTNLNNIEQAAKERLGMQKLSNSQKIYVDLPKEDYIAPATEQVVIEKELSFFQKLVKGFTKAIK